MSEEIRRSPRVIGFLDTKDGCERCAWWLDRLHQHPPFQHPMPGMMFAADAAQKAVFEKWVANGTVPACLHPYTDLKEIIECGGYKKFTALHPSGIWLHGVTDVLAVRNDNTLAILDNKSATFKGADDPFMPQYRVQVTGYAWIAEVLYKKAVSGTALVYWEPQRAAVVEDPLKYLKGSTLSLPLKPKLYEIERDYDAFHKLVKAYKKIITSKVPPKGKIGCKNCAALEHLCEIHSQIVAKAQTHLRDGAVRFDPFLISVRDALLRDLHQARFSGLDEWMRLEPEYADVATL